MRRRSGWRAGCAPAARWSPRPPIPAPLPKATKTAAELAGIRAAHVRDGAALTRFLCWLDRAAASGRLERDRGSRAARGVPRRGRALSRAQLPDDLGGRRARRDRPLPGFAATDALLAAGHPLPRRFRRAVPRRHHRRHPHGGIGEPTAEMRERFTLVLKGHIALATARFPRGTTGSQLDALARLALWRAGLDYDHGTGHGVGFYLGVHEGPQRISKLPSRVRAAAGHGRLERARLLQAGRLRHPHRESGGGHAGRDAAGGEQELLGFETLTLAPIDRRLIVREMLDEARSPGSTPTTHVSRRALRRWSTRRPAPGSPRRPDPSGRTAERRVPTTS